MSAAKTVTFYLHPKLRRQAENGNHNFLRLVAEVVAEAGLTVAFDGDDDLARIRAMARPGHSLWLMQDPPNARGLTFRRTYLYPFWHIEKQAARWDWPVAQDRFDAATVPAHKAANFLRYWRKHLFDDAPLQASEDGFVYVPLQGQLLRHRSFQSCSPLAMLERIIVADLQREIIATLHPGESYTDAELQALSALEAAHPRFRVGHNSMADYLQNCDYVVTQNSSAGFMGYFFEKPLMLFAHVDFHHIALRGDAPDAFQAITEHRPDYAVYLYWFLQMRAINAGRPEAKKRIRTVLRGHGWPV